MKSQKLYKIVLILVTIVVVVICLAVLIFLSVRLHRQNLIQKSSEYSQIIRQHGARIQQTRLNQKPFDIPIYYINLDRSPERRAVFESQANTLGLQYTRIPAVDGRKVGTDGSIDGIRFKNDFTSMSNSEIGCTLSHLKAIKQAYDQKLDIVLIMEDDISFEFVNVWPENVLQRLLEDIPEDFGILQLSWLPRGSSSNCGYNTYMKVTKLSKGKSCTSTGAYLISRKGMIDILEFNNQLRDHPSFSIRYVKGMDKTNGGNADFYIYYPTSTYISGIPLFTPNNTNPIMGTTIDDREKNYDNAHVVDYATLVKLYAREIQKHGAIQYFKK